MKLKTQYASGVMLSVVLPTAYVTYRITNNKTLSETEIKAIAATSVTGRTLIVTGHLRLLSRIIKKFKK